MFCPHCGAPTRDEDAWCSACGAVLPGARGYAVEPQRSRQIIALTGGPGIRLLIYTVAGLATVLLVGEVLRFVLVLALPLIVLVAVLAWTRSRRRRLYDR
jgi:zinc-ribbon domain